MSHMHFWLSICQATTQPILFLCLFLCNQKASQTTRFSHRGCVGCPRPVITADSKTCPHHLHILPLTSTPSSGADVSRACLNSGEVNQKLLLQVAGASNRPFLLTVCPYRRVRKDWEQGQENKFASLISVTKIKYISVRWFFFFFFQAERFQLAPIRVLGSDVFS